MNPIDRPNISEDIAIQVRDLIISGELEAGGRINEVALSKKLGISRTPLREALNFIQAKRYLDVIPRRGFFVKALSQEEIEQLYPIRLLLDPAALKIAGIPDRNQIKKLEILNDKIRKTKTNVNTATKIVDLDDQWHRLLLEHCPNKILLDLIDDHIWKTRRYEVLYMDEGVNVKRVAREHDLIINALKKGDLPKACKGLVQNMSTSRDPISNKITLTK